ncbi:acetyl-CoA C-acyltransferase [Ruicaihuangia caeni]|uniref:Probable acetyl-CoA acetyltransferase n=1 Tax=Ruicaihuangia caeni TaxID=3042517 RepID=A0AAW6T6X6_9MICO|nr:acetyl-CoA C-acyltransferase [Klugiella sp. YN-L-19]MDI2097392.1 acetyl-CoA C-acyltransferase [Klugiella sp. YN-L-19]
MRPPVIVSAARTPIGKLNGALAGVSARRLGAAAAAEALSRAGDASVDSVLIGSVLQAAGGQNPARSIAFDAGVSLQVPAITLNDVCLAGASAVRLASMAIRLGESQAALVGGADSMTRAPHAVRLRGAVKAGDVDLVDLMVHDGLTCAISGDGMGVIAETANTALGIGRAEQDAFALRSHRRAAQARQEGRFADEIVPVDSVGDDEGIRSDTDLQRLGSLRSVFAEGGSITAGNASQLSDGASMGVLANADYAASLGLEPIVQVVASSVVAGPDVSLHLKPARAAEKVLAAAGLSVADIGLWEVNEAYAGVVIATQRDLGLDEETVNVNGGAIALGHPLGGSAFRLIMSLALQMRRDAVEFGVATLCGGGGQGEAVLLRFAGR